MLLDVDNNMNSWLLLLKVMSIVCFPQIICEVMAFFLESPERTSPTFSSDDFFVGIKASLTLPLIIDLDVKSETRSLSPL